jgi:hypothetical protein
LRFTPALLDQKLTPASNSPAHLEELRFESTDHVDWYALQMDAGRLGSRKLKRAVKLLTLENVKNLLVNI